MQNLWGCRCRRVVDLELPIINFDEHSITVKQFVFDYLIALRVRFAIRPKYFSIDLLFYERN